MPPAQPEVLKDLPGKPVPYVLAAQSGRGHQLIDQVGRCVVGAEESNDRMSAMTLVGPKGMPIPLHYHDHEYEFFFCFDGIVQLWTDDESRQMVPGDFGYVPPGTVHSYQLHRPGSGFVGPVIPAGWDRFFDFCGEPFDGPAYPPGPYSLPPFEKFKAAEEKFEMKYKDGAEWAAPRFDAPDNELPGEQRPYFLRRGEGERHLLGGQLQTAICRTQETNGVCAITTVELPGGATMPAHSHAHTQETLIVIDGVIKVTLDGKEWSAGRGDTVNIPKGCVHSYEGATRYAKLLSMSAPGGLEKLFALAGEPSEVPIFPAAAPPKIDIAVAAKAAGDLDIEIRVMDEQEIRAHNEALNARFGEARLAMANDPVEDPYEVNVTRDIEYSCPEGQVLLLDLHMPARPSGPCPAIIWVHGGAWMAGDRSFAPDLDSYFAARGYAMLNIEYRLSGEFKFPAALEDVRAAVRWARTNASEYGFDSDAIGLWGSSAGAHLAVLAAVTARADEDRVQAVVDGYGPTDLALADEQRLAGGSIHAALDSPDAIFLGTPLADAPQDLLDAVNPVKHVTSGAPPFLILHGTADMLVPSGQSVILHEALVAAGAQSTLCLVEGADHGFFNGKYLERRPGPAIEVRTNADSRETSGPGPGLSFQLMERFFDRHLRRDPFGR